MSLHGTIIKLSPDKYGFEAISTHYAEPISIRHVWELERVRTGGYSYCRIDDAIGKPATCTDGRVSCYLGQGNSLTGDMSQGGSTKAITIEQSPIPRPKCRVETRWHNGRWEKYTKAKGWQPA